MFTIGSGVRGEPKVNQRIEMYSFEIEMIIETCCNGKLLST